MNEMNNEENVNNQVTPSAEAVTSTPEPVQVVTEEVPSPQPEPSSEVVVQEPAPIVVEESGVEAAPVVVEENVTAQETPAATEIPETPVVEAAQTVSEVVQQSVPAEPVQSVEPVQESTPTEAVQAAGVQTTPAEVPVPSVTPQTDQSTSEVKSVSEFANNEENVQEPDGKLRFPLVVVLLLVIFIVFLFVYYFVLTTPKQLFGKALKQQISAITELLVPHGNENYDSAAYLMNTKFEASSNQNSNFLNGLEYKLNVSHDIKNGNFGVDLTSNIDSLSTKNQITYNQDIESSYYYYDNSILYKFSDNILKTDTSGDSANNTADIISLFDEVMYEAIDLIDVAKVNRSLETKKVRNQSLLAIKYSTSFDNTELNRIWSTTIDNILDTSKHADFVKKFAKELDITEAEALDKIKGYKDIKIESKNVTLDYYINLACNSLVALELNVDGTVISISYMGDHYFVDINNDELDIDLNYNVLFAELDGTIVIDNEEAYSYIVVDTNVSLNDSYEKINSNINIDFYGENSKGSSTKMDKPYLSIKNNIVYEYGKEVTLFDTSKVIDIENASQEDKNKLDYIKEKFNYDFGYLYGLNTINRTNKDLKEYASSFGKDEEEGNNVPVAEQVVSKPETNDDENVINQNIATQSE